MTNQIHIAAQYLATASINFLEKKEDDSHTNLGFNSEKGYLETWPLDDKGCKMAFDYHQFSLHWLKNENTRLNLLLDGKTHKEVVKWISEVSLALGRKEPYVYELHYNLPYAKITDDFTFRKPAQNELNTLLKLRHIAQGALEKIIDTLGLDTTVRIWPHHFDTGAFVYLGGETNHAIGLGLAIPDTMIDDYYFYLSGYSGHKQLDTSNFNKLTQGKWHNNGFKGAVLPATGIEQKTANVFLSEAFHAYAN